MNKSNFYVILCSDHYRRFNFWSPWQSKNLKMNRPLLHGRKKRLLNGVDDRSTYSDMAITTVLMMKRVFGLSLRALQGFVDSIFKLMGLPLRCSDYSLIRKRAKTVKISIKTPTRGEISHLVIDGTGLKVFGEGEWKVRQHGADRRRVWRKLHLAADSVTHEIICADLSLSGTRDAQALPALISQTHRKIREASADGAYDTRYCHDALLRKKIRPLIPPQGGAQYWPDRYHERNHAVANQRLIGSNDVWKKKVGYHRRSVAETAIFRFKTLMGDHLSLRDYDAQEVRQWRWSKRLTKL